jgi:hypothetical protein
VPDVDGKILFEPDNQSTATPLLPFLALVRLHLLYTSNPLGIDKMLTISSCLVILAAFASAAPASLNVDHHAQSPFEHKGPIDPLKRECGTSLPD